MNFSMKIKAKTGREKGLQDGTETEELLPIAEAFFARFREIFGKFVFY